MLSEFRGLSPVSVFLLGNEGGKGEGGGERESENFEGAF